jgi:hypothetical protein
MGYTSDPSYYAYKSPGVWWATRLGAPHAPLPTPPPPPPLPTHIAPAQPDAAAGESDIEPMTGLPRNRGVTKDTQE